MSANIYFNTTTYLREDIALSSRELQVGRFFNITILSRHELKQKQNWETFNAKKNLLDSLDGWLTVHRSITLIDFQLDVKNSYLFIYNIFIKILYMFRALPCSSSGGLRRNCIHAASGIVTLCRWLSCSLVKKETVHRTVTCREWRYQRLHIYNYDVDLLKMSRVMLETCRGF